MIVKISTSGGFCWGVRRALRITEEILEKEKNSSIYTFGPLIHNNQVIQRLASKGIKVLEQLATQKNSNNPILIICAHGIPPEKEKEFISYDYHIVDATCPHVAKSQKIIEDYSNKGYYIIIAGDKEHAEVISLKGFAKNVSVVASPAKAKAIKLPKNSSILLIAQSTFNKNIFHKICSILNDKYNEKLKIFNSICSATAKTQQELKQLCQESNAIIVIGGKNSANTNRLEEIVKSMNLPCFRIETALELPLKKLNSYDQIGITAGASTPEWIVNDTINKIKNAFNDVEIQEFNFIPNK